MMNCETFYKFCLSLPGVTEKMPFQAFPAARSILAFYIGNKIFCYFDIDKFDVCTVKCTPNEIDELKEWYHAVDAPAKASSSVGWRFRSLPSAAVNVKVCPRL